MAILPAGFALPPLPYLIALLAGLAGVGWLLSRRRPAVTERAVLAFVPWIVLGAALHVLYVVEALPATVRPLAGTPSVYLTVALAAGVAWLAIDRGDEGRTARRLGVVGGLTVLPAVGTALAVGVGRGSLALAPVAGIVIVAAVVTVAAWALLRRIRPGVSVTGRVGLLALAAHALDGVSTGVGVDLLGFGERTPLSRLVIEFAAGLPTAPLIGSGWLFVLVKLAVAGTVVVALAETVRETPTEGRLLLGFVAAVGLGPGVHNLLLFAVVG
jgi:uncharacterized membrane protein